MTHIELKLLRKYLFFSVAEAANEIAKVKARTWQRYETGEFKIPADVKDKIIELVKKRFQLIESHNFENETCRNVVDSAKTEILAKNIVIYSTSTN